MKGTTAEYYVKGGAFSALKDCLHLISVLLVKVLEDEEKEPHNLKPLMQLSCRARCWLDS